MESALYEIIEKLPKVFILLINLIISLIVMVIKYYFDKYKREKELLSSSKINLQAFIKILDCAITNQDKNLAKEHYKQLLNNSYLFYKCKLLNTAFIKLQEYYIGLQIESFNSSEKIGEVLKKIELINIDLENKCC